MKVAYQGIGGSYSEAVAYNHFGKDADLVGYDIFEDVFEAVKNGEADYAVLPFENTITGSLSMNYDLLLKEGLYIIAEVFHRVKHNLMSHKGNDIKNIKTVYSHPQALEQCRDFLIKNKLKGIPEYDTAGSAKIVKERNNNEEAAIASELCASIYNLDILENDIEKNKHNITKFFVLVKKENIPKDIKKEKTSIVFKTKHYSGALVNCLQRLSKNDVNLTKLESRPIPENAWEYVFYADLDAGIEDENVKLALTEMEATTEFVKVLGSYPKAK